MRALFYTLFLSSILYSLGIHAQEEDSTPKKITPPAPVVLAYVLLETNRGDIKLELYKHKAPKTVKNFIRYVNDGFYNDTVFHRVIPGFMIQGGGFTKELAKKKTKTPIKNEASEKFKNVRGSIAMARLSAPHTATSQFFINLQDNPNLDYREYNPGYAVFGRIISGLTVIDNIAKAKTDNVGMHRNVPIDAVIIIKATVIASPQQAPEPENTQPIDMNDDNTEH